MLRGDKVGGLNWVEDVERIGGREIVQWVVYEECVGAAGLQVVSGLEAVGSAGRFGATGGEWRSVGALGKK